MSLTVKCITLNTCQLSLQLEFYQALGLDLKSQKVDKGSQVYRARLATGMEFCLFGVMERKNAGSPPLQLEFIIQDIDKVFEKIKAIPGVFVILDPTDLPDGRKAILKDVDGNAVELLREA